MVLKKCHGNLWKFVIKPIFKIARYAEMIFGNTFYSGFYML